MLWKLVYERGFGNEMELVAAVEEGMLDGMLREELAGTFKELKMLIVFCAGFDVCWLLEDVVYSLLLVRAESS
ncbi:hypothetical protein HanRHA438_Chr04g0167481 [Helianthus annuus]|uniref:Uncharacterized protein n=1 Tax=Helianthus annuus TaxID=4232 RepID=A0A9K3NQL3_HELAN|nr:hypothetical protein HanXRQr2_Chr04g0157311 [Helianthus annuus]KAJ0580446.1 hypothetical protein HanHA300_Chr04g0129321 [Helianthus annuus]KAJ0588012.1 hypothetical protein HanIR_Chr04g0169721 [Helianthus annuus]KAJ0596404.1 hypothetical protein HanHA89_Chr04g0142371 [Helianthus annuus]KAJ0757063.1 hypothetical protein HanLR1_Chr04g0134281 [Helianthus annuus]